MKEIKAKTDKHGGMGYCAKNDCIEMYREMVKARLDTIDWIKKSIPGMIEAWINCYEEWTQGKV